MEAYYLLKNEQDAKDVVQEVFVDLWDRYDLSQIQSIRSYLSKAVHNRCLNVIKAGKSHQEKFFEYVFHAKTTGQPDLQEKEYLALEEDRLRSLKKVIATLPPKTATIFDLYYIQRKSRKQVASELGISINTVKTALIRALKQLRKKIR